MRKFLVALFMAICSTASAAEVSTELYTAVNFYDDLGVAPGIGVKSTISNAFPVDIVGSIEYSQSSLELVDVNKTFAFERDYDVHVITTFIGVEYEVASLGFADIFVGAGPELAYLTSNNTGDFDPGFGGKAYGIAKLNITDDIYGTIGGGYRFLEADFDAGQSIHWFATVDRNVSLSGPFVTASIGYKF